MTEQPDNSGRNPDGTFAAGNQVNPSGKPRGARHRVMRAKEELLEGEHEKLTRKASAALLSLSQPTKSPPTRRDASWRC
jgi:hypothetical protein